MSRHRALTPVLALAVILAVCPTGISAQQGAGFRVPPAGNLVVPEFADRDVAGLIAELDTALGPRQPSLSSDDAGYTLWTFVRRLQAGRLTPSQEASVVEHLLALGHTNTEIRSQLEQARLMVETLTVGKTAPDAAGYDLQGREFKLSDYRGKVVVLAFSADWCGICRSQYPYYRFMQDLYTNWPFAILGVEASTREAAGRLKAQHGLAYRSWLDDPAGENGRGGPIASAWNVRGWPTTYVLDAHGVVRFVNLRDEDLLKGVRQLLTEHVDAASDAAARSR